MLKKVFTYIAAIPFFASLLFIGLPVFAMSMDHDMEMGDCMGGICMAVDQNCFEHCFSEREARADLKVPSQDLIVSVIIPARLETVVAGKDSPTLPYQEFFQSTDQLLTIIKLE